MPDRITQFDRLLREMTDAEIAKAWARCIRALRDRDVVRSSNIVGDYAEKVCCDRDRRMKRTPPSEKSVDATKGKLRFQIKGRRITPWNKSRELGAMRELEKKPFDVLLAVFFSEDMDVDEIWQIPSEVVEEAPFVKRTSSTKFVLTKERQRDPRIRRLV